MNKIEGNCYCKKITFQVELPKRSEEYNPRACDCKFCVKHGSSYLSDPNGSLVFYLNEKKDLRRYNQDDTNGIADMLICANCGVLVGVVHSEDEQTWGAVNTLAIEPSVNFNEKMVASPKRLPDEEKIKRWKQIWFPNVKIILKSDSPK